MIFLVLIPDLFQEALVQNIVFGFHDDVVCHIPEFAFEPEVQRNSEALFGAVKNVVRKYGLKRLLQDVLAYPRTQFEIAWDGRDELHEFMIKHGGAHLQRNGHTSAIHLCKNVVGEVCFDIHVLNLRE